MVMRYLVIRTEQYQIYFAVWYARLHDLISDIRSKFCHLSAIRIQFDRNVLITVVAYIQLSGVN